MDTASDRAGHEGRIIRAAIRSAADADLFWRAWTEADKFRAWFVDDAEGEVTPGNVWTWVWNDFGMRAPYRVVEADPPRRLFVRAEAPIPGALLEVRIERSTETEIEVVNSGFGEDEASADQVAGVQSGWTIALAILKRYVERYFGEPRTRVFLMRPASFEYAGLDSLYRSGPGLARWLTRDGSVGEPGSRAELTLWNGETLTGNVLAATGRETALAWDEMRGVIELKAFSAGPAQKMIAIAGSFWNAPRPAEELRALLTERFDALAGAVAASA